MCPCVGYTVGERTDSALVRREHNRDVTPSTPPTCDLGSLADLPDAVEY